MPKGKGTGTGRPAKKGGTGAKHGDAEPQGAPPPTLSPPRIAAAPPEAALPLRCPSGDLPEGYGLDRAVLLPRDPQAAFLYWEVSEAAACRAGGGAGFILRLLDEDAGRPIEEVGGAGRIGRWYFHLPRAGMRVSTEVGWRGPGGGFARLLASNTVKLPRGGPGRRETPGSSGPARRRTA